MLLTTTPFTYAVFRNADLLKQTCKLSVTLQKINVYMLKYLNAENNTKSVV